MIDLLELEASLDLHLPTSVHVELALAPSVRPSVRTDVIRVPDSRGLRKGERVVPYLVGTYRPTTSGLQVMKFEFDTNGNI
jgi:hypothetical protein